MKRSLLRAYIVVFVLALLALTGSMVWRVAALREERYQAAASDFEMLSREAAELWQSLPLEEATRDFAKRLTTPGTPHRVMISVSALDQGFDYIWAVSDRFMPAGHDGHRYATLPDGVGALSHVQFTRTFGLPRGDRRVITALYPLFDRYQLYGIFRDTLMAALVLLSLAILVAFVQREAPRRRTLPATPSEEEMAQPLLVSESFLKDRLGAELERAGFSEQDLTVAIIAFNEGSRGNQIDVQNCETVRSFFPFKDLCFELGRRDVVVLIPNVTLTESLGLLERFQRYYWEQRVLWNRPSADFHCGLTSRAARLVDADRILSECRAALRRSRSTPGRIVGFQPDPQKYREYISDRGKESA